MIHKVLTTGIATRSPLAVSAGPGNYLGAPIRDMRRCVGCHRCQEVCPTGALDSWDSCDVGKCSTCRLCGAVCEAGAITYAENSELASRSQADLVRPMRDGGRTDVIGPILAREIRDVLGRSLHIRHVDSGSCNACDWEMTALLNPVHDLQQYGIDFVPSPRHADMVMVTGGVSAHLKEALLSAHRCMAEPRLVMALGSCACGGGVTASSYATCGGVNKVLPVDVYVPGCPPRPQAIIYALLAMLGRLRGANATG